MKPKRRRLDRNYWYDDQGRRVSRPPKSKPELPVGVVAVRHPGLVAGEKGDV